MFTLNIENNIGRGMILYIHVHKSLSAVEVKLETEFQESIFARIQLNNKEKLLIGLVYRSPSDSGNSSNNENLIQLFKEASILDFSHKLFIGDFNYPCINWETWSCTNNSTTTPEFRFIECIRDFFLTQHTV